MKFKYHIILLLSFFIFIIWYSLFLIKNKNYKTIQNNLNQKIKYVIVSHPFMSADNYYNTDDIYYSKFYKSNSWFINYLNQTWDKIFLLYRTNYWINHTQTLVLKNNQNIESKILNIIKKQKQENPDIKLLNKHYLFSYKLNEKILRKYHLKFFRNIIISDWRIARNTIYHKYYEYQLLNK